MRTIIVGGGIAGVALSKFLAQRGVTVTLLEKTVQLCSGVTWHAVDCQVEQRLVTQFHHSCHNYLCTNRCAYFT